jgi:putative phosphoribosyl transferase
MEEAMPHERFHDRRDAGRVLADHLIELRGAPGLLVLALPRGGLPVADEIAAALDAPLDIFLVRKLGVPGHPELAMGAIGSGGVRIVNHDVVGMLRIDPGIIEAVAREEEREMDRREREYRGDRPEPEVRGRTVLLVDDGLATGSTMRAAAEAVRAMDPRELIIAVPVGARETCDELAEIADRVVCARTPDPFQAVGLWYEDFSQTTDEEVREILARSRGNEVGESPAGPRETVEEAVTIPAGRAELQADLVVPPDVAGLILFAHGSGSGRHSTRNRYVARTLNEAGLATLLLDLLTEEEEAADARTGHLRFDIPLLAGRLADATRWARGDPRVGSLPVGYFGASTGGGAALIAAADLPDAVGAVVSRGGRPDLADEALPRVRAPTLLVVGSLDLPVIGMNRRAMARMTAPVELEIVPGATHLFGEPGKLEEVAGLAREWFTRHLAGGRGAPERSFTSAEERR